MITLFNAKNQSHYSEGTVMNKAFKVIGYAACCLSNAFLLGCVESPELESLGSVKLASGGAGCLAIQISKSHAQPYRLQFQSPGTEVEKMSEQDGLEVYLENNDALPLTIYLNSKKARITIAPKKSERIFIGSFKGLLLAGNGEYEDFTIETSRDRKINAALKFARLSGSDELVINVRSWRIKYGL